MQEIAQATLTYEHFPEVMQMLWKRMFQDNKKNYRRTYKVNGNGHTIFSWKTTLFEAWQFQ